MKETSKSKKIWGPIEKAIIVGKGIDIGCGDDPVSESVRKFDRADGDANEITKCIMEQFDYVFASHCLEHMKDPRKTLAEWWKLVKPNGHLFFLVPDEDLYEQGVFPSRFNPDHKATFTISKSRSWSPVSINVLELARNLPNAELVSLVLQDNNYDHRRQKHGRHGPISWLARWAVLNMRRGNRRFGLPIAWPEMVCLALARDQTLKRDVVAQIQCIVRKVVRL